MIYRLLAWIRPLYSSLSIQEVYGFDTL